MTTLGNDIKALKQQMNLQVLQRSFGVDTIHSIEHTFDHVVLYEYNSKKKEWKKKQVEGTCFIVRRKDQSVSLVIMNRLNVNNFVLLMNEQSVQVGYQAPYFFIQTNSNNNNNNNSNSNNNSIYGLWFYREQNANQLMQFCQEHIFKSSSIINQSSSVEDETKTSMLLSQMFDSVKQQQQQQTTTNGSLSNNNNNNMNGTTTNGIVQAMMMQSTQQQPHHHHHHHVNPHHHHPMMMMNGAPLQQPQQHHGVVVPAHSPINGVSSSASVSSSPDMLEQISKLSGFTLNRQNTTNVSTTSTPTTTTTTSAPVNQTNYNRGVTAATAAVTTTANKPVRLDPKKSLLTPECLMRGLEQSKK